MTGYGVEGRSSVQRTFGTLGTRGTDLTSLRLAPLLLLTAALLLRDPLLN